MLLSLVSFLVLSINSFDLGIMIIHCTFSHLASKSLPQEQLKMDIQSSFKPVWDIILLSFVWGLTFPIRYLLKSRLPKHLAFVPDGNRRFAKLNGMKTIEGHIKGRGRVEAMILICYFLGIKEISFYVFSVHNFKRSKEELDGLSEQCDKFFNQLKKQLPLLMQTGIKIRAIGNEHSERNSLILKADDRISLIRQVVDATSKNENLTVNFFMNYSARDEICRGIKAVVNKDVDTSGANGIALIQRILKAARKSDVNDVDLFVRTSGETRLSDFLLYESRNAKFHFVDKLWPEFSVFDLLKSLYSYAFA